MNERDLNLLKIFALPKKLREATIEALKRTGRNIFAASAFQEEARKRREKKIGQTLPAKPSEIHPQAP